VTLDACAGASRWQVALSLADGTGPLDVAYDRHGHRLDLAVAPAD
jgi:hypothetical protein